MAGFFTDDPTLPSVPNSSSIEDAEGLRPSLTGGESLHAGFKEGYNENFVSSAFFLKSLLDLDNGAPKLDPKELNKKFPDLAKPFTVPMNEVQAQFVADQQAERQQRRSILTYEPDSYYNKTMGFAGGMLGHALDPVEAGAGIAVGWAVGGMAAAGMISARFAIPTAKQTAVAIAAGRTTVGREVLAAAGRGAVEGVAGNLMVEPLIGAAQSQIGDYGLDDSLFSVMAGAGAGLLLSGGAKGFGHLAYRKSPDFTNTMVELAYAQANEGKYVSLDPVIRAEVAKTSHVPKPGEGKVFDGQVTYEYQSRPKPEAGKFVYASSNKGLNPDGYTQFSNGWRTRMDATDNPFAANGVGGNDVIKMELTGDYVETGSKVGSNSSVKQAIDDTVDEFGLGNMFELNEKLGGKKLEDMTVREFLDEIQNLEAAAKAGDESIPEGVEEVLDALNQKFKDAGFDGYHSDGTRIGPAEHSPHNVYSMFPGAKAAIVERLKHDPSIVKQPTMADAQKVMDSENSPSRRRNYSQDAANEVNQRLKNPIGDEDPHKIQAEFDQQVADLEESLKVNPDDATIKAELDELKALDEGSKHSEAMYRMAAHCLGGKRG